MAAAVSDWIGLLFPQAVPPQTLIAQWAACDSQCLAVYQWRLGSTEPIGNEAMLVELDELLTQIPSAGLPIGDPQGPPDELAHDAYFHIKRMEEANAPWVLLRSILCARQVFLREVECAPVTIRNSELERIDRAFADLLSCFFGEKVNSGRHVTVWKSRGMECDPSRRWVRGHMVFAALTQGLILSFRTLAQALLSGQNDEIRRWADLSISLFHGSNAAFLFTGDFAPGEYEKTIRPSMSPPASPIGLSGLMSADHRYLAKIMRDMCPALKSLAEREPERHEHMVAALNGVYDSHVYVCERFVGARPSLLTEGRTERSGPSLIEQFRTLRLKPFARAPHEPRLAGPSALGECPFHN